VTISSTIEIQGENFVTGQPVTVTPHSASIILGTAKANQAGNISLTAVIPASTAPGKHRLFVTQPEGATATLPIEVVTDKLPAAGTGINAPTLGAVLRLSAGLVAMLVLRYSPAERG